MMMNLYSEIDTVSTKNILDTLAKFLDAGEYEMEDVLAFISELTGASADALMEAVDKNQLCSPFFAEKKKNYVSRTQLIDILRSYVSFDLEAADPAYVRDVLESSGCDKEIAEKIGLDCIWPEEDEQRSGNT